tara:strand:+ start:250 stop:708 length:459 start_codon:yes stop_codon:yes gene_type:complete
MVLEIGMKAPNFSLNNHKGEKKINKNYQGKKLVIFFYPKDDTPGCTKESCRFRDINSELNSADCEVVGVSADGEKSHVEFIKKYDLNFELLSDTDYKMAKDYETFFVSEQFGNSIKRTTFLLDENGLIMRIWKNIKNPESHPDDIINFLKTN